MSVATVLNDRQQVKDNKDVPVASWLSECVAVSVSRSLLELSLCTLVRSTLLELGPDFTPGQNLSRRDNKLRVLSLPGHHRNPVLQFFQSLPGLLLPGVK